jgi:hypothetical protein
VIFPYTQKMDFKQTNLLDQCFSFETGSHCVAQADLEFEILLLQSSECSDCRRVPPHLAKINQCCRAGVVAHAYNPGYSGGRDLEDGGSRPAWTKSSADPISTNDCMGWFISVIPATWGNTNGKTEVQAIPGIKQDPISKINNASQAPVAHACNPSYSGGRDQEDCSSKPAQANSSRDPVSKNPSQKRAGGVAQGEGPVFKPQYFNK